MLTDDEGLLLFSNVWQPSASPMDAVAEQLGASREVHTWVVDLSTRELIDLSLWRLPQTAERTLGLVWSEKKPGSFFWGDPMNLPENAAYIPDLNATQYTVEKLLTLVDQKILPLRMVPVLRKQLEQIATYRRDHAVERKSEVGSGD